MTKAELIAALDGIPDGAIVVVDGYEGGFDDPFIAFGWAVLNHPVSYLGKHMDRTTWMGRPRDGQTPVVVLARDAHEFSKDEAEARAVIMGQTDADD